ncbi:LuxR C-terminal-related transcriptional regulator [Kribbella sp. NPDC054772]
MTAGEVVLLAEARGVCLSARVAERLRVHTGGLPGAGTALLDELPREVWDEAEPVLPAPAEVVARVREAMGSLSAAARRLVQTVGVVGDPEPLSVAADQAELAGDVWGLVDEAERAGLIVVSGVPGAQLVQPADPMVAAAVRAELGRQRTVEIHRAAAATATDPAVRLRHLVAAATGPDAELAGELAALAEDCAAQGEWGKAAALLTASSRMTEDRLLREARLTSAVDALLGAGDGPGARALIPAIESLRETPLRNAVLGYLAILRGRGAEAEVWLARAWELTNVERSPEVGAAIAQRYVLHSLARCHWQELVTWADRALELADLSEPAGVEAAAIRGLGLVARGESAAARATYADLTEQVRLGAQVQRVRLGAGWLQLALDDVEAARAELESAVPTGVLGGSARISLWASAWLGRTQFLLGEWDRALDTCTAAEPLLRRSEIELTGPIMAYATALIALNRYDYAEAVLSAHEERARDHPSVVARLARTRGRLQAALGNLDAAWDSFDRALSALEDSPLRFDRARVEFAYGQALRRAGKRRQASSYLSSAREVFEALRATTYVARCDRELNAGGSRTERRTADLTPQEQTITGLVATGLSNREVAAQLFLSTKTVQYHLTRVYAKLGISTRAELAALHGAANEKHS